MPIIEWSDRYLIGVPQIDKHHQHLFFLLNKTYDDFFSPTPTHDLESLFDELVDYATYHFAAEEQLMQNHLFPGLEMHRQEHVKFSQRVVEMSRDSNAGKKGLSLEILSFLHTWLSAHILSSDAEIGRFLAIAGTSKRGRRTINVTI
jgi:hemerythrin